MKRNYIPYIIIIFMGFIFNAFMCNMSPFRDCLFCSDVNCFFMEGKAWALGYIPYVDFIDSKGPLLFLIFAIGYLITPESTIGVYLLASFSSIITFFFVYKIALYFIKSNHQAILVTICCATALFFKPYYGYGPRTEQFIIPFVTWIIYILTTKTKKLDKEIKYWNYFGICLGICTAVFFLTKYVYIIFPITTYISSIILLNNSILRRKKIFNISCAFFLSFIFTCLPFIIYLILTNSFDEFIWSYFQLSAQYATPTQFNKIEKFFSFITILINQTLKEPVFYIGISSILVFYVPFYKNQLNYKSRLTCILSFLSLIFCCSIGLYPYYLVVYFPLFIFPLIFILTQLSIRNKLSIIISLLIILISISTYSLSIKIKQYYRLATAPVAWCRDYDCIENIIKSKYRAKIMYLDQLGQGFGIRTGAVPACRSWFSLTREGQELKSMRENAIKNKIPDFVFISHNSSYKQLLQASGYKYLITILEGSNMQQGIMLWSKS